MRRPAPLLALLLLGCDKPAPPAPAPAATVSAAPMVTAAPPATATASASAAPRRPPLPTAPSFTAGSSKAPSFKEWKEAPEVAVRNARSLWCEAKAVREWLRVSCRTSESNGNHVEGVAVEGTPKGEVYKFHRPGVGSAVIGVRPGAEVKVVYQWSHWGERTLTVSYPKGAEAPKISFDAPAPAGRAGLPLCADVCAVPWNLKGDVDCSTPCGEGMRCEVWHDPGGSLAYCLCDTECAMEEEKPDQGMAL